MCLCWSLELDACPERMSQCDGLRKCPAHVSPPVVRARLGRLTGLRWLWDWTARGHQYGLLGLPGDYCHCCSDSINHQINILRPRVPRSKPGASGLTDWLCLVLLISASPELTCRNRFWSSRWRSPSDKLGPSLRIIIIGPDPGQSQTN